MKKTTTTLLWSVVFGKTDAQERRELRSLLYLKPDPKVPHARSLSDMFQSSK